MRHAILVAALMFLVFLGCSKSGDELVPPVASEPVVKQESNRANPESSDAESNSSSSSKQPPKDGQSVGQVQESVAGAKANEQQSPVKSQNLEKLPESVKPGLPPVRDPLVAFSPSGKLFAFAGKTGAVGVYNVEEKRLLKILYHPELRPFSLAFARDDRGLVVGGRDGNYKHFSLESVGGMDVYAKESERLSDSTAATKVLNVEITAAALESENGSLVVGGSNGDVLQWSMTTPSGSRIYQASDSGLSRVGCLRCQGKDYIFAINSENRLLSWPAEEDSASPEFFPGGRISGAPTAVAKSADGTKLVIGDSTGRVSIWTDSAEGLASREIQIHDTAIAAAGFATEGGDLLTLAADGEFCRNQLDAYEPLNAKTLDPPAFQVLSPDGNFVAVPSRQKSLDVFSSEDGSPKYRYSFPNPLTSAALLNEENSVVVGDNTGAVFFQDASVRSRGRFIAGTSAITSLGVSPLQQNVLCALAADGRLVLGDCPSPPKSIGKVKGNLAVADEEGSVVVLVSESKLTAFNTETAEELAQTTFSKGKVTTAAVTGQAVLFGTEQGDVYQWDYLSGSEPQQKSTGLHDSPILGLGLDSLGRLLTCDASGVVRCTTSNAGALTEISGKIDPPVKVVSNLNELWLINSQGNLETIPSPKESAREVELPQDLKPASDLAVGPEKLVIRSADGKQLGVLENTDAKNLLFSMVAVGDGGLLSSPELSGKTLAFSIAADRWYALNFESTVPGQKAGEAVGNSVAPEDLTNCLISPGNRCLIARTETGKFFIETDSGSSHLLDLPSDLIPLAMSPDGDLLIAQAGGRLKCFRIAVNKSTLLHEFGDSMGEPSSAVFLSGQRAVIAFPSRGTFIFNIAEPESGKWLVEGNVPQKVDYSPQLASVGIVGKDGSVQLVDIGSGEVWFTSSNGFFSTALGCSKDRFLIADAQGNVFTVGRDGELMPCALLPAVVTQLFGSESSDELLCLTDAGEIFISSESSFQAGLAMRVAATQGPLAARRSNGRWELIGRQSRQILAAVPELLSLGSFKELKLSADGGWAVGVSEKGGIQRLELTNSGVRSLPSRQAGVQGLIRLTERDRFVLFRGREMAEFDAHSDEVIKVLELPFDVHPVAANFSVAIVEGEGGRWAVDLLSGSRVALANLSEAKWILPLEGRQDWLVINRDGGYRRMRQLADLGISNRFELGQAVQTSNVSAGLLRVLVDGSPAVINSEGTNLVKISKPNFPATMVVGPHDQVQLAALAKDGRALFSSGGSATREVQLALTNISSAVWAGELQGIALSDGDTISVVDNQSGELISEVAIPMGVRSLVHCSNDGAIFLDRAGNLQSVRLPCRRWVAQTVDSPIQVVSWSVGGDSLLASTAAGDLIRFEARSGRILVRKPSGYSKILALEAVQRTKNHVGLSEKGEVFLINESLDCNPLNQAAGFVFDDIVVDEAGRFLYGLAPTGVIYGFDLSNSMGTFRRFQAEFKPSRCSMTANGKLVASNSEDKLFVVLDPNRFGQVSRRLSEKVTSGLFAPSGAFVVTAKNSNALQIVPLGSISEKVTLTGSGTLIRLFAMSADGQRLAAISESASGAGELKLWDSVSLKVLATKRIDTKPTGIVFSSDGTLLALSYPESRRVELLDGLTGKLLEEVPAEPGLKSVEFSSNRQLLLGYSRDAGAASTAVELKTLRVIGRLSTGNTAVSSLSLIKNGTLLLSANMAGEIRVLNKQRLLAPEIKLRGPTAPLKSCRVSPDEKFLAASFADERNSILMWNLSKLMAGLPSPPLTIENAVPASVVGFAGISRYLMIGQEDGNILAWETETQRTVVNFKGHQGRVLEIAQVGGIDRFVSAGSDNVIKFWKFPANQSTTDSAIPTGTLVEALQITAPSVPVQANNEAKPDSQTSAGETAARQLLRAGGEAEAAVKALRGSGDSAAAIETLRELRRLKADKNASPADLANARKKIAEQVKGRGIASDETTAKTWVDGDNLRLVTDSNFAFKFDRHYQPVKLLFLGDFLFAARPSTGALPQSDSSVAAKVDDGSLVGWSLTTNLRCYDWSLSQLSVEAIYPLSNELGVFTAPDLVIFQQDGRSHRLGRAESWVLSNFPKGSRQFLAVGTAGTYKSEADILRIYGVDEFSQADLKPVTGFRSFEGVVTALAFANSSPFLAFCVRERAVHRLFIAKIEDGELRLTKVAEYAHRRPWLIGNVSDEGEISTEKEQKAAPGINELVFSPDDRFLIAHGRYEERQNKVSGWRLEWSENRESLVSTQTAFADIVENIVEDEKPLLTVTRLQDVWFIKSAKTSEINAQEKAEKLPAKPKNSDGLMDPYRVVLRMADGFQVINLSSGSVERTIPYLQSQRGITQCEVSENGQWILMGNDSGMAYLYYTLTGARRSVTVVNETEPERPAHTGPIVGVGLSAPDEGMDFPVYAATIGEENKLKVWSVFEILNQHSEASSPSTGGK